MVNGPCSTAVEDRPLATAHCPSTEDIQPVLCKGPGFIEADNVQFPSHIDSVHRLASCDPRHVGITHFWGLMQKIPCFFRRERAKLVPIVRVAGRAGGTTIVMRSRARTTIRCQESCHLSAIARSITLGSSTYAQSHEIDERGYETKERDHPHHCNVAERITVKFEARRLREEH